MALSRGSEAVFIFCTFVLSFPGFMIISTVGTASDIYCLKSIKDSLEDTRNYLKSSWDFSNQREGFICTFLGVECWHANENKVLNIRLSDMGLKGNFPRGLENCTSLTGLDLSSNELQGPIPPDIARRLPYVTSLDLSFNNFSAEIPSSIADCHYLNVLKLDHNQLRGHIPQEIGQLDRIKIFSVANNLLSGQVPDLRSTAVTEYSYANNQGLCGGPLARCSSRQRKFNWKFDNSFKSGFFIGYQVFATSAVVLFTSWVPWVQVGKRKKKITILEMIILMIRSKQKRTEDRKEINMLGKVVSRMSFADLSNATGNFSRGNIIGSGRMGTMYKATLPNGWFLAVKKIHDTSPQFEEQTVSELKTLGRLRHNNFLPLLGFCVESNERLLVYNYVSNGNLFDWLHSVKNQKKILEWPLRVKIAVGTARGLAWLHHGCRSQVVHLSLCSKCILLDKNFEPKLSNFERAIHIRKRQTNFSMDSEFWDWGFVKKDVFSFGVLLLELITGEKPNFANSFDGSIAKWICDLSTYSSSCLYEAIDSSLTGKGFDSEIFSLLRVACGCVQPSPDRRPSMLDVYETLSTIGARYGFRDVSEKCTSSNCCFKFHR